MTFYSFMMKTYLNEDTAEGDLAGDMKREKESFPRNRACKFKGWHRLIKEYLIDNNACDNCLEVFDRCWEEYVKCEKMKSKKYSQKQ